MKRRKRMGGRGGVWHRYTNDGGLQGRLSLALVLADQLRLKVL